MEICRLVCGQFSTLNWQQSGQRWHRFECFVVSSQKLALCLHTNTGISARHHLQITDSDTVAVTDTVNQKLALLLLILGDPILWREGERAHIPDLAYIFKSRQNGLQKTIQII